uniref:exosortase A n=1 Tax=Parerythrobacter lutipelagi TaxID=1964208 RepID=UPI0010F5F5A1|nr:exosortase A [Parerythrobacter lutipelagi]
MSLEATASPGASAAGATSLPLQWRSALTRFAMVCAAVLAVTWRDWWAMSDQWWNISTYNHILLVPPIIGWLIYIRRDALLEIDPAPWWPGLLPLAGAMFLWLLGSVAGVNSASQLGAVATLMLAVPATLGPRVALACAFPLAYMLFLVPFGDELVPTLQMVTAAIVIWLTEASGIPAVIDGVFIDTPVGLFEVAEACSGVKFLVAMIALGVLVCYACFKRWKMRFLFMAAAIILPVLANGIRAWGTIYIAQSQGIAFAEGFDHIFYGWVFFAVIVFLLLAAFWRSFDRDPDELGIDFPQFMNSSWMNRLAIPARATGLHLAAALLFIAGMFGWQFAASTIAADIPEQIALPDVPGWERVDYKPDVAWSPRMNGADHKLLGRYRDAKGREIDVSFALYAAQSEGREAGATGEGALIPDTAWRWVGPWEANTESSGEELLAFGQVRRFAATSYRTGSVLTGKTSSLKLQSMRDRLLMAGKPTMTLILSVEGADREAAKQTLADFGAATGDRGEWMDRIARVR